VNALVKDDRDFGGGSQEAHFTSSGEHLSEST